MGRRPFDPWREIHDRGDADLALAFGRLFWPVFVEQLGCVVIEHRAVDGAIADALERAKGDPRRVEELLNRVSLRQEMFFEDSEVEDETFMDVGRIMQRSWMAALAEQFPGRQFVVRLLDSDDDWHGPTLYLMARRCPGLRSEIPALRREVTAGMLERRVVRSPNDRRNHERRTHG